MNFEHLLNNIPDYKVFLTVDEMNESSRKLAQDYPDLVTMWEAGKSTKGEPIYALKIGEGSKNAFMFGCPHPNEPMGCMMLEYFRKDVLLVSGDDTNIKITTKNDFSYAEYLLKEKIFV